jgi:hypothetical protein
MNRFLNSYSAESDRTNATVMPPLIPPRVRTFCHLTGIFTLKILKKVLPPYTTTALDIIIMANGAAMMRVCLLSLLEPDNLPSLEHYYYNLELFVLFSISILF